MLPSTGTLIGARVNMDHTEEFRGIHRLRGWRVEEWAVGAFVVAIFLGQIYVGATVPVAILLLPAIVAARVAAGSMPRWPPPAGLAALCVLALIVSVQWLSGRGPRGRNDLVVYLPLLYAGLTMVALTGVKVSGRVLRRAMFVGGSVAGATLLLTLSLGDPAHYALPGHDPRVTASRQAEVLARLEAEAAAARGQTAEDEGAERSHGGAPFSPGEPPDPSSEENALAPPPETGENPPAAPPEAAENPPAAPPETVENPPAAPPVTTDAGPGVDGQAPSPAAGPTRSVSGRPELQELGSESFGSTRAIADGPAPLVSTPAQRLPNVVREYYRLKAQVRTPLGASNYLAAMFVFLFNVALYTRTTWAIGLFAIVTACTLSRSGALFLVSSVLLWWGLSMTARRRRVVLLVATVSLLAVVTAPLLSQLTYVPGAESLSIRMSLLSMGFDAVNLNLLYGSPRSEVMRSLGYAITWNPHSAPLQLAVLFGLIGLAAYGIYAVIAMRAVGRLARQSRFWQGAGAGLVVMLIWSLTEIIVLNPTFEILIATLYVAACGDRDATSDTTSQSGTTSF